MFRESWRVNSAWGQVNSLVRRFARGIRGRRRLCMVPCRTCSNCIRIRIRILFVNGEHVSEPFVQENKNYYVNTLENKTMAKSFTMAQLKEWLEIHENTIIKSFTNRVENLESKITSMQEENRQLKGEVKSCRNQ